MRHSRATPKTEEPTSEPNMVTTEPRKNLHNSPTPLLETSITSSLGSVKKNEPLKLSNAKVIGASAVPKHTVAGRARDP